MAALTNIIIRCLKRSVMYYRLRNSHRSRHMFIITENFKNTIVGIEILNVRGEL